MHTINEMLIGKSQFKPRVKARIGPRATEEEAGEEIPPGAEEEAEEEIPPEAGEGVAGQELTNARSRYQPSSSSSSPRMHLVLLCRHHHGQKTYQLGEHQVLDKLRDGTRLCRDY